MTVGDRVITGTGVEYIVDIYGCDPDLLRSRERLDAIMSRLISEVGVRRFGTRCGRCSRARRHHRPVAAR